MCRQCGALVGAGESRCMMCGAPLAGPQTAQPPPPQADRETVRFVRAVVTRPATFTFLFLIANVFVYVLMRLSGGATGNVLLAYGAKLNYLIDQGQWWRFVTPIFLHVDMPGFVAFPLHLLVNMYGLFMLGPYVEKLYGSAKFVVFWVATGMAGVAASYLTVQPALADGSLGRFLFKPYDVPSAGASGALFGLIGVLFVFGIKFRHELPDGLKRAFGTGMLPMILINLFIGYVGRGLIDNAAHLGGLVSGMLLALFVGYKRLGPRGPVAHTWHVLQVACLVLVVVCFVMVARNFDAPPPRFGNPPARPASGGAPDIVSYIEAMNAGQVALAEFGRGSGEGLDEAIKNLEETPGVSETATALRDDLKALLVRARELGGEQGLTRRERERRLEQLDADFGEWQQRFEQWANTEGRKFGVMMKKVPQQPDEEKSK